MSLYPQPLLDLHEKLLIDGFAGGGGASSAIEQAYGRPVDIAINHDKAAIEMHKANHPQSLHLQSDIFEVDPVKVCQGRPVAFAWFSPDCTDHSKAKGGKPIRTTRRRSLAWVVTRWAGTVRPEVICLENVEEFQQWSPLIGLPGTYRRCPRRKGLRFKQWVKSLTSLGYQVEWRELRACDYGAPTIRKRLYVIARCDGQPIVWPEPSHGDPNSEAVQSGRLKPWRTAAECIDWSVPMLSIFATKEEAEVWAKERSQARPIRPLADNTMKRIARGVKRFVLENPKPFLVTLAHGEVSPGGVKRWGNAERDMTKPMTVVSCSNETAVVSPLIGGVGGRAGQSPERSGDQPLGTVTAKADAAVIAPLISPITHAGERATPPASDPLATITTANRGEQAVIAPYLVPRYGEREGQEPRVRSVEEPAPVIVPDGNGGSLVAAHMTTFRHGATGHELSEPAKTVTANAHHEDSNPGGATPMGIVAANLATYYGDKGESEPRGAMLDDPIATIPTENRHAVVASFMAQHNGGHYMAGEKGAGRPIDAPVSTLCNEGSNQALVAANMVELHGTAGAEDIDKPLGTLAASGQHYAAVATHIQREFGQSVGSKSDEPIGTVTPGGMGKAGLIASFLQKYYGQGVGQSAEQPAHTIPTVDRFGLVTVNIGEETYYIEDIAMRMLQPHELYRAQGFRDSYIIDRGADGRKLTKTEQVRMCGNSVSPPVAEAIARANRPDLIVRQKGRAA